MQDRLWSAHSGGIYLWHVRSGTTDWSTVTQEHFRDTLPHGWEGLIPSNMYHNPDDPVDVMTNDPWALFYFSLYKFLRLTKTQNNRSCVLLHMCVQPLHAPANCDRKSAILSVDRIRYRYGRPAAVHGIDVANRSGDRMARRSLSDWHQGLGRHGTNNESHTMSCATQKSRNSREPHAESACGDRTRRKGNPIPPDRMYTWHGQQKCFPPSISFSSMTRLTAYTTM
jgi:hypothetical protein